VRRLRSEDPRVVVLQFPLLGVPLTLPFVVGIWIWPTPWEWLLLLVMGVFTQIGQFKMTEGLRYERAARATAVSYAQIPFSIVLGLVFFAEMPSGWSLAGAACIVCGTLWVAQAGERGVAPAR
jgi:drug/metabolite transporter (DMT)-like permease